MKVLILSTVHRWNDPRIFHKQACSLAKVHDVTLCAVGEGENHDIQGMHLRPLGVWKSRQDRPYLWLRALQEIFHSRAQVIHFHDPELALLLLPWALFGKVKVIWDVHEHPRGGYAGREWIPRPLRVPVGYLFAKLIKHAPAIFDIIILAEDGYLPYFPQSNRIHVIHNYALIPEPDPPFVERYANFDPQRELRLVYFGQLLVQRGAWKMVEMVEKLAPKYPGVHLDLVGEALPRSLGVELQQAADRLQGRIRLHGYVDYAEGIKLVQQAHLGLVPLQPDPNHKDSMATKFFDYMIHGLPFIVSDLPHWRRFIEENPCGVLCDPGSSARWVETIVELAESPPKLQELSRNGYRLVREKYRWEEEKLLDIYRELKPSHHE